MILSREAGDDGVGERKIAYGPALANAVRQFLGSNSLAESHPGRCEAKSRDQRSTRRRGGSRLALRASRMTTLGAG